LDSLKRRDQWKKLEYWEDNIKMYLKDDEKVRPVYIRLRIGTNGRLL
jgi:hypothetical protein